MYKNLKSFFGRINWLLVSGLMLVVLGSIAVSLPFVVSMAVELLFGLLALIAGISQVITAIFCQKWKSFFLHLLSGMLYCSFGSLLLVYPFEGVILFSLILGIFFTTEGLAKIIFVLRLKPMHSWGWILFNGIITLLLGALICMKLPFSGMWAIGLLLGINMLFGGLAISMFSLAPKNKQ